MLKEHLGYVSDGVRLERFRAAVAKIVKPGDRIADLGCGSGVLGLLCFQAGAAHVVAIDDTAMLEVARETLQRAGHCEQSTFIRGRSQRVAVSQTVDVVICDHVGYFGFDYGIVSMLQDARKRFLGPGGRIVPARVRLSLAAVESPAARAKADDWQARGVPPEFHWLGQHAVNTKHDVELTPGELLSAPAGIGEIDFCRDAPEFLSWTAQLRISRDGVLHGLAGWFDCELAEGVWMTNSPLAEDAIERPQAFLPIEEAVAVRAGELATATVMARPDDNLIAWTVDLPESGAAIQSVDVARSHADPGGHGAIQLFPGSKPEPRRLGTNDNSELL